jgi:hypothetical protein
MRLMVAHIRQRAHHGVRTTRFVNLCVMLVSTNDSSVWEQPVVRGAFVVNDFLSRHALETAL